MAPSKKPIVFRNAAGELVVERFSRPRRWEHTVVTVGFILLVLTGLPQKFHGPVSAWILGILGGLDNARFIHRVAGVTFVLQAVVHLSVFVGGVLKGALRPSLIPTVQDLRDARDNLSYYFGFRATPPPLPKFDYRQKFEYIGLILGGMVMIFSGLVLMFPQQVAGFLPGVTIPVAQMLHTNEAMLAFLVLVVWHVYGSILSPDVFPLDTSIFTGNMTVEELKHHHRLEYDRLFPGGHPESQLAPPTPPPPAATVEPKPLSAHG